MRQSTVDMLVSVGLDVDEVRDIVLRALAEDLGPGGVDVTSAATIPAEQTDAAELVARAEGVVAGLPVAAAVFDAAAQLVGAAQDQRSTAAQLVGAAQGQRSTAAQLVGAARGQRSTASAGTVEIRLSTKDGERVARGDVLATVAGPTRALLTAERTALNLLCRMSGVATHTRRWADLLAGSRATVLDTRKTTPGLRILDKYAVRAGGGANKRMGLYDVAMIKDNHKLAAGSITAAYQRVREAFPEVPVQVEVTTVAEAVEAVDAGADFLLCDNMSPALLREVVAAVGGRSVAGRVELEATGNLTLDVAREYADTGVDYLSVGALTHSSPILDIAMDLRQATAEHGRPINASAPD